MGLLEGVLTAGLGVRGPRDRRDPRRTGEEGWEEEGVGGGGGRLVG